MLRRRDFVILSALFTLAAVVAVFEDRPDTRRIASVEISIQNTISDHINAVRGRQAKLANDIHANSQVRAVLAKIADAQSFDFIGTPHRLTNQRAYEQLVEITRGNGRNLHLRYRLVRNANGVWRITNIAVSKATSLNI